MKPSDLYPQLDAIWAENPGAKVQIALTFDRRGTLSEAKVESVTPLESDSLQLKIKEVIKAAEDAGAHYTECLSDKTVTVMAVFSANDDHKPSDQLLTQVEIRSLNRDGKQIADALTDETVLVTYRTSPQIFQLVGSSKPCGIVTFELTLAPK